ncbi:NAD-binding protein [Caenimonas koreensis DSM 17982]|uniref:NAD-binding protein n=1 Tax=Caenimonas koreensis DSM 17982 TaxID=1121255 RepID=A0A844AYW9_9BURK|nr:NAD(P)-dependent oxidoreductase [Caenimonas koreensis]MRD47608.1 NAD-binding protein [Caenimonas koreensis DSM 17982]
MKRVAMVGVGNMGGAMCQRLLEQRWPVQIFDIDSAKMAALQAHGAVPCADAAHATDGCDVLIVCVVDAAQTQEVLFGPRGAAAAMGAGQVVVLCPTISPADVEGFAARLAERGVAVIDAPMSGGPVRAREGTMSLMVACDHAVFDEHSAMLNVLSGHIFRISEKPGDGARTKLVNNLLAGINLAGAAEAMAMAQRLGLDLARTLAVIEQSSAQSWIGSDRMKRAIAGDYEPRAHVTLLQKDTRLAVEAAAAAGFSCTLGPVARDVFESATRAGLGGLDDAALFRFFTARR